MNTTSMILTLTTRIRRALLRHRVSRLRKRQRQMALPFEGAPSAALGGYAETDP